MAAAKRRVRFQFSMIGMKPGTVLHLAKDPKITCTTTDERNQVVYNGVATSLSDAALKAYSLLGQEAVALSGPWEWTFEGRRLDEIRRETEDAAE